MAAGNPSGASPPSCCTPDPSSAAGKGPRHWLLPLAAGLALWGVLYSLLPALSRWATHSLLGLSPETHLAAAVEFFLYDAPKVLLLLVLVVFVVGVVQSFISPQLVRRVLAGKKEFAGNVLAALFGIVTPFCTCSAIPLFIGFVTAGVPLGVTFSYLISAPMVNEVALVLLFGLFGWKVAMYYLATGLAIAIASGWVIGRLKMERHVEEWVNQAVAGEGEVEASLSWGDRLRLGWASVGEIVGRVWPWLLVGIAVGAGIHGFVPQEALAGVMGKGAWWSVPAAVLIGIPLYSNAAGIIPVVQALLGKGAALGTVLAFMMAVVGLSLPEVIILRRVLKLRLIAVFLGVVGTGILLVGYLFNALL